MVSDRDRWSQAKSLFQRAIDLPEDQRSGFVERATPHDPELRAEVETLLTHVVSSGSFLEEPVRDLAAVLLNEGDDRVGSRIGVYRITAQIARGGMGTVYKAERSDEQFEVCVAIKVLRRGLDTEDVYRRFLAERQILARLNHPGIAGLMDGGITEDGLPYFVMELVEGLPITAYVTQQDLRPSRTIELFLAVCDAVGHAHRNLVLHRDLKPSNILVEEGRVRLLDFGISKVLDDRPQEDQALTTGGQRYLTKGYASPEQVRGEPLTTGADVYSLGIVLFELLTGQRPEDDGEGVRTVRGARRPSAAAGDRVMGGRRVASVLKGDLDTVLLKALQPDPGRRYGTVSELSDDLARYLKRLPIRARGDSIGYRAMKFVGRHRLAVASAALFVVTILGAAAGFALQSVKIRQERDKAREVTAFMVDLFEGADPWGVYGDSLPARSLVDRGAERVDRELGRNPEARGTLLDALGQVYHSLGMLEQAEESLRRAVELRREHLGRGPALAESLNNLGIVLDARASFDDAEVALREALELRQAVSPEGLQVAESLNDLGQLLLYARREVDEAEVLLRRSLALRESGVASPHQDLAETLHNLGLVHQLRGEYPEAVTHYEESLAMRRSLFGESHPALVSTVNNLALVLHSLGNYDQARPLYEESLATRIERLGSDHPSVPLAQANIGLLLYDVGAFEEAVPYHRRAVQAFEKTLGVSHPRTATTQNNLANLLRDLGEMGEAEALYERSLETRLSVLGAEHPHVAFSLNGLGALRRRQGRLAEADSLLTAALDLRLNSVGPEHVEVAETRYELGMLALTAGDVPRAMAELEQALAIRQRALGATHPKVADVHVAIGRALSLEGDVEGARVALGAALRIREGFPPGHWKRAEVRELLEAF